MNILALDVSGKATGWAAGDAFGPPRSGSVKFKADSRGQTGLNLARWLKSKIQTEAPALVVYEAPLFMANQAAAASTARLLMGLSFMVEVGCAASSVPVEDVAISTWRKAFLGTGRPTDPKRAGILMCQSLGWEVEADDNRADACGVWAWAHLLRGEKKAMLRLLSRGGLMVRG